jgi:hypothetical protein
MVLAGVYDMSRYDTGHEIISKVDYEGGWYDGVMGYGISPEDVPDYLVEDFEELVSAGERFQMLTRRINRKIEEREGAWEYSDW